MAVTPESWGLKRARRGSAGNFPSKLKGFAVARSPLPLPLPHPLPPNHPTLPGTYLRALRKVNELVHPLMLKTKYYQQFHTNNYQILREISQRSVRRVYLLSEIAMIY